MTKLKVAISTPQVDEYQDISYTQIKNQWNCYDLHMTLLVPRTEQLKPAILFLPGGGFKESHYHKLVQLRLALANAGFIVAGAEYQPLPAKFPGPVLNAKMALGYLREHAQELRLDPQKIIVMGDSAGGYLAQLLGVTSGTTQWLPQNLAVEKTLVSAVVSLYGFSDLTTLKGTHAASPTAPEALLLYGIQWHEQQPKTVVSDPDSAQQASPIYHVRPGLMPFLLLHGTDDHLVSPQQTAIMAKALEKQGNPVTYWQLTGADHGSVEWCQASLHERIVQWCCQQVGWSPEQIWDNSLTI